MSPSLRKRLMQYSSFHFAPVFLWAYSLHSFKRPLVIVYQMGKVGSTSVRESLYSQGFTPVQVHRLGLEKREGKIKHRPSPPFTFKQKLHRTFFRVRRNVLPKVFDRYFVKKGQGVKFITLVREPVSRNISGFFQNPHRFTGDRNMANFSQEALLDIFLDVYNHNIPLNWFDREIKQVLGIDVYDHPFPQQTGHLAIKEGNYEILILKLETDNGVKEQALAQFLNLSRFELLRAHVGEDKDFGNIYRTFKQNVKLPQDYIDRMYSSRYATHFYSQSEIAGFRARWERR